MTAELLRLFPTPVIVDQMEGADQLNRDLETAILEQRERDGGLKLSNRGGWQSKRDFPRWAGEPGQQVLRHAIKLASANTGFRPERGPPQWNVDVWANVSESGGFNMPHVHGGTFWSAVYYVRAGEGEGGQLVLHDPRMPALRMHAPALRFKDMGPDVRTEIEPKSGLMILFPAWLLHSVEPWEGDGHRISVAMNIRAAPPQRRS
ncbi:MAG TPA: TIGR02466 family protein [Sphingomicrobium sp.]|nr:TIGR02466 family protein [Sphingomicrobium sp.]